MAERDSYKHELDVMKQNRVNRQAKNSVFLNLFMRKEYQPEERQEAVTAAIDLCIKKNPVRYLDEHRPEVEKIMITMFQTRKIPGHGHCDRTQADSVLFTSFGALTLDF